ncbi:hypothetical protein D3C85_1182830 [compost metagenome]
MRDTRLVCSMICPLISVISPSSSRSSRRFCARQAIPVIGLPISWATPAARRPMLARRSECTSLSSSIWVSVKSSTSNTRPLLPGARGSSIAALCRFSQRVWPSRARCCLCKCSSGTLMKPCSSSFQGSLRVLRREPTTRCAAIPVSSSMALFHMRISWSLANEHTPIGNSCKVWR